MADVTSEERDIYRIAALILILVIVHGLARRYVGDAAAWGIASFVYLTALFFAVAKRKGVSLPLYLLFAAATSGFAYAASILVHTLPEF